MSKNNHLRDYRRHMLLPLVALVSLLAVMAASSGFWFVRGQDRAEVAEQGNLVNLAIRSWMTDLPWHLNKVTPLGAGAASSSGDRPHFSDVDRRYLRDLQTADFTMIVGPGDRPLDIAIGAAQRSAPADILSDTAIRAAIARGQRGASVTGLAFVRRTPALFTVAPDRHSRAVLDRPTLLMIKVLDANTLGEISREYALKDLAWTPVASNGLFGLRTYDGRSAGALTWSVSKPGSEMAESFTFAAIGICCLTALLAAIVLRSGRHALERAEQAGEEATEKAIIARKASDALQAAQVTLRDQEARARSDLEVTIARVQAENAGLVAEVEAARRMALRDAKAKLMGGLLPAFKGLEDSFGELAVRAADLRSSSDQNADQLQSARSSVEGTAQRFAEVVPSVRALAVSIEEIRSHTVSTNDNVRSAERDCLETQGQVAVLSDAASAMMSIISNIDSLSRQTNFLALNAFIEAARAGDAGRGFAVVAQELKGLADATVALTREVSDELSGTQSLINETVARIDNVVARVTAIGESSSSIARAVHAHADATLEIDTVTQHAQRESETLLTVMGNLDAIGVEAVTTSASVDKAGHAATAQLTVVQSNIASFIANLEAA